MAAYGADPRYDKDFDRFWRFVEDRYAYLGDRATDWDAVRAELEPRAAAAGSRDELVGVLEDALDQLYDPHCMLNTNTDASWRPVPHGVWAEWRDGEAVVTAVQQGSAAQSAGIVAGDVVLRVDGQDLAAVVDQRRPRLLRTSDPRADAWALLSAVAGRHGDHALEVRHRDGTVLDASLPPTGSPSTDSDPEPITWERVEPNLGRIEIHSFGDSGEVGAFDRALEELRGVDGLIVDLRSNSGGDTEVALPMLGRLLRERAQYAWMARRRGSALGERWPEFVDPRGEPVDLPVVAIVDRFTVSMGEGFAMALQDTGRGKIVGTPMGGLGAAIGRITLRRSGIPVQISTEPIWAADGTPRDALVPDVPVDPIATGTTPGDPFLAAAVEALARR